jgi:protein SCO1/2
MNRRTWLEGTLAALGCAAVAGIWLGQTLSTASTQRVVEPRPAVRDFSLTDTAGQVVTLSTYRGKWILLFFGFTGCPEACPLAMQTVAAAMTSMGQRGKAIQPIFVTIDPERDRPDVLKDYLTNFSDKIVGLSGTAEQTAAMARLYGVYYAKRALDGGYTMDHSTALYLVAPDGTYVRPFRANVDPGQLADEISTSITSWKE